MKYRTLGASDLHVSEIALGTMIYGNGVDRDVARACIDRAFALGINFIDTANAYGLGTTETLLGEVLAERPRDSYVLATKVFFPMGDGDRGLSRAQILKQLDASLGRLRTDYIDLYQCHRFDPETPLSETMEALTEVVRMGKVRYVGFSEWHAAQVEAALAVPGTVRFVSSQPQYSLLCRAPEKAIMPFCAAHGISQIVWSPLAQGALTGKYQNADTVPEGSRATSAAMGRYMHLWLTPSILKTVEALKPLAHEAGCSLAQFSLAWVLSNPNVAAAIIGASRPGQLEENVKAVELAIPSRLFRDAEAIVTALVSAP